MELYPSWGQGITSQLQGRAYINWRRDLRAYINWERSAKNPFNKLNLPHSMARVIADVYQQTQNNWRKKHYHILLTANFFFRWCLSAAFWGIFFSSPIPALSPKVTTGCDRAFHSCPPPLPPHSTHLPPDIGLHGQQLLGHWQHRVQCHHGRDHEQHGCCNQGPSAITTQCHSQSFHNSCNYALPTILLQKRTTLFLELESTTSHTF